ncbi:hypothetical protein P152DRAFT_388900 [Eremomyces bilateralis CBS 781.70]|uniref:PQ-loop-domain-containing protein n=1 Tax=Eremomyces bilateralis CBS 781.70 TaxID=1392243 RepID=A0A6G1GDA7_9PEZI|nr:uncharacterized protein P152DRAFT_388900 [Eremomyces bilateralis CBS 781.70]KAF1816085.1 hypothetical protein P152DRAFT_388900 [Eremomyces bilateralis CBS 781.70]
MAIQQDVPLAAQVLATIGTICWCVQLLPQIWQNYRRGNCIAFPALTVFIWAISEVPFGAYVIVQDHAMAIQLQPQIFGVLCLVCWGQCLWLSGKCSKLWATFWPFLLAAVMAVGQFLLIWTLRVGYPGRTMPIKVVWAFAAAGLVVGLIPQYVQQFKRQGRNLGFSWGFLAVDLAGALFSFLAMAVRKQFDVFGGTLYLIV